PEYPLDALREIVVNALIHRDYSVAGSTCRIFMFDDKIEFYSPGGLCAPTNVTNIESTQFLRNKNLVEAMFYEGDYVEKLGTGVTRMKNYLKQAGLKEPKFFDNGTDFEVVVYGPEDRVLQIEKSDRAKKLRKTIGMARKPEEVSESLEDFKKEDREMLEEKIRHEKKKEEAKIKRKALHRKITVATMIFFGMIFVFLYGKRINSPEYIIDRAATMHSQKDYRQASRYYKKFIAKYPKSMAVEDAYYFLGACLEMMGDDTGAIENYQKAIAIFPNGKRRAYSQFWIGKLQLKDKRYDDAINSFRQSIGTYSEKELIDDAIENIADCYKQMGKYEDVVKTYQEMLKINESVSDGHELCEIAAAYEKLGEPDKAREYYLKVTMNKATSVEWLEKARTRLVALEGEKFKIETKEKEQ
ncbi:MAG TPA: tetratricopeptide repeat protein, partial [bacterium]|nr:tetratricopeptide repeat protein [bacterium]